MLYFIRCLFQDYLGDLLISMCYNPTQSRITIVVMKCTNVKVMDITGSCGKYIAYSTFHTHMMINLLYSQLFDFVAKYLTTKFPCRPCKCCQQISNKECSTLERPNGIYLETGGIARDFHKNRGISREGVPDLNGMICPSISNM